MIRLGSDFHLEFYLDYFISRNLAFIKEKAHQILPPMPNDKKTTLVLAGDIILLKHLSHYLPIFEIWSEQFKDVIWVFGNHEWFLKAIKPELIESTKLKLAHLENFHVLNNEIYENEHYHFVGTTLWSDINKADYLTAMDVVAVSYDYKKISFKEGERYSNLRPRQVSKMFKDNELFIQESLLKLKSSPKIKVVVTHHPPTVKAITEYMKLTPDYWSDFGNVNFKYLVEHDIEPTWWLHGHIHETQTITEGNTTILSNTWGYDDVDKKGDLMLNKNYQSEFLLNQDSVNK